MALQKQNIPINFSQSLDTKTDPYQVPAGKFLILSNSIFDKGNLLQKRNGFQRLVSLPDDTFTYLNTFNGALTAIGTSLSAYSSSSQSWVSKGTIIPVQLDTLPLVRTTSNQSQVDTSISGNGLVCTVYTNDSPSTTYNYTIADSTTGQNIVESTLIATPSEAPRVFLLENYFIILYSQAANLKYIAVPIHNPSSPIAAVTLITNYSAGGTMLAFDGVVSNNKLYVAYNATDGGGAIRMSYLNSFLVRQTAATGVNVANAKSATMMSICSDETGVTPVIWVAYFLTAGTLGYVLAVTPQLVTILASTSVITIETVLNITCTAQNSIITFIYEVQNTYSYGASLPTNYIVRNTTTIAGVVGSGQQILKGAGLASKSFLMDGTAYVLTAYSSTYQPSYFVIDENSRVIAKLAYANGGGYLTHGLPSATITDRVAQIGYLIKDLIVPANKSQNPSSTTPVFTQTGINLVSFLFTSDGMNASEIGHNLNISGGELWTYDGYQVVEQGFNLYPDNVVVTTTTGAGGLTAQTYFYQAVYEWADRQGNIHRSAPSIAVSQVTTTASSTNTIKVPTYRPTNKPFVKIVLYRWSTAQPVYYQVTSLTSPTFSSTAADSVTITDAAADSAIVGNSIIYTTGGVVENIAAPATKATTLFRSRLFLIDSEDQNLLWYSKQVIEGTPVEMSDLFTIFVAPTVGAQGDTGPISALSSMDDKLIIFKRNAIYYLTGTGPDNTGANNDFSEPVFITSTIGCTNQNSIVFMPNGIMFQSDKGIWLLGRDLTTTYIGAPVQEFNSSTVLSALTIPGTNQVRFILSSGDVLMYDYFYGQWGVFKNIPQISSILFEHLHTFIDSHGRVFQENPLSYVDGSNPVLIDFETGWFNMAGLQGYERAYFLYLLATYYTPHKLTVSISYDYSESPSQTVVITPDNFSGTYGTDSLYGGSSPYGGMGSLEQWRVFLAKQKCQAFKIRVTESFDSSFGTSPGAGFTMSGINAIIGMKSNYPRIPASRSIG